MGNIGPVPAWLGFALLTLFFWGLYGAFLHNGQLAMNDEANGRWKAFLFVCVAYFVMMLVTLVVLRANDATMQFTAAGISWGLCAGFVGSAGAFFVLKSFGLGGNPAVVMTIVFAGAQIVNAFVTYLLHTPAGGLANIRWQFVAGVALATIGGILVTLHSPTAVAKRVAQSTVTSMEAPTSK